MLYWSPDRLARKFADPALLIKEISLGRTVFGLIDLAVVSRVIFPGDKTA